MKKGVFNFYHRLGMLGPTSIHALTLVLIFAIGLVDYLTGFEVGVSFFYLVPIGIVSWFGHGRFWLLAAALSAGVGQLANDLAGELHSSVYVSVWNDLVQILVFGTVAYLLRHVRTLLHRAERLAQQDFLTGLLNRRALIDRLHSELSRASRSRQALVIGFVDLDHFKAVNDSLGHSEGDRLLYSISQELSKTLRRSDIFARVGGDEFVLVLPDSDASSAESVGQKIVETMAQLSAANNWPVTASVGLLYIQTPNPVEDLTEIFEAADNLMYEVKESGRNNYIVRAWA